jgi:hypothetical protein
MSGLELLATLTATAIRDRTVATASSVKTTPLLCGTPTPKYRFQGRNGAMSNRTAATMSRPVFHRFAEALGAADGCGCLDSRAAGR